MTKTTLNNIKAEVMEMHNAIIDWVCPKGTILLLMACIAITDVWAAILMMFLAMAWIGMAFEPECEEIIIELIEEA
jgi:hypothetical protein